MKKKIKKEIEYEDAPSGYVTFYNYKEPLMKFEGGFGFVGALVFDGESDKIQCHFCGEWFGQLAHHLAKEHGMKASDYKEQVGLLQTTALISESSREKLIASGMKKRMKNLKNRKGKVVTQETRDKISRTLRGNAVKDEFLNYKGTCPAQLIDRIQKIYKRDPEGWRVRKLKGMEGSIKKIYGSVKDVCRIAGVPYMNPGQNWTKKDKYTREDAKDFIKQFVVAYRETPTYKDFEKQGKVGLYNKIIKNGKTLKGIAKESQLEMEEYIKTDLNIRYTNAQLIGFLRHFEKLNKRKPSYSDCRRGLLPPLSTYSTRFKGFKNALKLI
jgi:hypothetical protein